MRLRGLVVVLLSSGCQQPSPPPEPAIVLENPPALEGPRRASGAEGSHPGAPDELQTPQTSPADEIPDQTWSARSASGSVEVQQTALRNGKATRCTIISTLSPPSGERSVMWQWDTCIATREQLKFISPDGKRVLVLEPFPASLQGNWRDVEVATLYEHGLRVKGTTAGALVSKLDEAREPSARFAWLKGVAGLPGTPPRYTSEGTAVEVEAVDGRSFRLGFEGAANTSGMYQYKDDKGTSHFVSSRGEVPARYRSRAAPVEAEVGIVPASVPLPGGEPRPSEPGPESPSLPKGSLEGLQSQSPTQLIERAREEAKKLEEAQRDKARQLDSLR